MGQPPVVIIGGGIGGLTTALTLLQHGIECEVYERAPESRSSATRSGAGGSRRRCNSRGTAASSARPRPRWLQPLFEASVLVVPNAVSLQGLHVLARGV